MLSPKQYEILSYMINEDFYKAYAEDYGFGHFLYSIVGAHRSSYFDLVNRQYIICLKKNVITNAYPRDTFNLYKITLAGLWALFVHNKKEISHEF